MSDTIFTKEELELGTAIRPSSKSSRGTPYRLCSHDGACGDGAAGCRRNDTILAFEAEFNSFVSPELYWGAQDQFFAQAGYIYYYKPYLEVQINDRKQIRAEDIASGEMTGHYNRVAEIIRGFNGYYPLIESLADVRAMIDRAPMGMPKFVAETPHFYQFEDVGTNLITSRYGFSKPILKKLAEMFKTDYTVPFTTQHNCFYEKNGEVYWTDPLRWAPNDCIAVRGRGFLFQEPTEPGTVYYFQLTQESPIVDILNHTIVSLGNTLVPIVANE
jgi:hypothetical protein